MTLIEEMNTAQLNADQEAGDEFPDATTDVAIQPTHNYNLRPRPMERNKCYIMTQVGNNN